MDAHSPNKTVPLKLKASNNFPWIDKDYIRLSKQRDALYYIVTKYGSNYLNLQKITYDNFDNTKPKNLKPKWCAHI